MPTFFRQYLCWEPCANVVSAYSRLWGQRRAVPALQIETGWNGQVGHQDFSPKLEMTRLLLVAQMVRNLPPMRGTQVWSLGWEDPLEKEMATHSSILA